MQHHRWIRLLASAVLGLALATAPARAQMAVIDPANLAQSIIQVTHAVEQIHNQVQQIEQQARMLTRNPLQLSPELSNSIGEARQLFEAANGMSFQLEQIGQDFRTLYPETWEEFDLDSVLQQSDRWIAEDRAVIERALRAEANAVAAVEAAQGRIDRALSSSANAEGQTGAVQAGNQLLGIQASQLAQIQALLAAQGRALTTERMERVAREERAREIQRRAFPTDRARAVDPARTAF